MDEALFGNAETTVVDELLAELHKVKGWPVDPVRDRALIAELREQFPRLDLADEFGKFRVWLLQQRPEEAERMVRSRGRLQRLRKWCQIASRGRTSGSKGQGRGRTSTAARPAEAFGVESSQSLSRW